MGIILATSVQREKSLLAVGFLRWAPQAAAFASSGRPVYLQPDPDSFSGLNPWSLVDWTMVDT